MQNILRLTVITAIISLCYSADGESVFKDKVKIGNLVDASGDSSCGVMKFDFSLKNDKMYSYHQVVVSDMMNGNMKQEINGTGKMIIRSLGDGIGEFIIDDMTITTKSVIHGKLNEATAKQPAMVVQGIKPDGSNAVKNSSGESLVSMVYPVNGKDVILGKAMLVENKSPLNINGSQLILYGDSKLTPVRHVIYNGRSGVLFDYEIAMNKIDVPKEMANTVGKSYIVGAGQFVYDFKNNMIIVCKLAFVMKMDAVQMPMTSDNFICYELSETP
jgi:hypothetical protein